MIILRQNYGQTIVRTSLLTITYLSYYTHTLRCFHILIHVHTHSPALRHRILELEIPLEMNESNP